MSLNSSEIAALVAELQPLVGSRVDAVRMHDERTVVIEFWKASGRVSMLLSAEADLTRIHAVRARPPAPRAPFSFLALLRRELHGARLAALAASPGDRVVELRLEGAERTRWLLAELTGRNGNIFLLDEARIIRGTAGRNLSSFRQLIPGRPYLPPEPRPSEEPPVRFAPAGSPEGDPFPLSVTVELLYAQKEEERLLQEGRKRLREPVRAAIARSKRALEKLVEEAARVPVAERDRQTADLLKANLHLLKRGMRQANLVEYTEQGGREVSIALDPSLDPRQSMERAYRRYRRIAESAARVAARATVVSERQQALVDLAAKIDQASISDLQHLEREARRLEAGPRPMPAPAKRRRAEVSLPYRQYRSLTGAVVMVGRGAKENDALTFRTARGNDLWLHARGRTGAHVVVRLQKGKEFDQETLLDAAHLAAHQSDSRGESLVEVAYTRVKHVRKPRGAAPGAVVYSQERTLLLRVEPARLQRILAGEESESTSKE